jgi:ATP-binding cassette subfamily F protein uup
LDVETLEALEARLAEYDGTLLVVSHDRYFLDAIVTSTLVFESDGVVRRHAGGYSDWLERHRSLAVSDAPPEAEKADHPEETDRRKEREKPAARKLSYKLQRELDALPQEIDDLERRVTQLRAAANDPALYQKPRADMEQRLEELRSTEQQLDAAVERWAELEQLAASVAPRTATDD